MADIPNITTPPNPENSLDAAANAFLKQDGGQPTKNAEHDESETSGLSEREAAAAFEQRDQQSEPEAEAAPAQEPEPATTTPANGELTPEAFMRDVRAWDDSRWDIECTGRSETEVQQLRAVQSWIKDRKAQHAETARLLPHWTDEKVKARELKELVAFAKSRGVTNEELAYFDVHGDARTLRLWHDAWQAEQRAHGPDPRLMSNEPARPAQPNKRDTDFTSAAKLARDGRRAERLNGVAQMFAIQAERGPQPQLLGRESAEARLRRTGRKVDAAKVFAARDRKRG